MPRASPDAARRKSSLARRRKACAGGRWWRGWHRRRRPRAARLILWCHEDLPLVLPEVARAMGGLAEEVALPGEDRLLDEIMTAEGLSRLRGYLAQHPPKTVEQRRKVLAAFLDKFVRPEQLEEEVTLPGWDADLVARMTEAYEADVLEIAALEGVTFIAP